MSNNKTSVSFNDLPIDIIELIAVKSGVEGWLALQRTCKYLSRLTSDDKIRKRVISKLTVCQEIQDEYKDWKVNGKFHRDNDLPALIVPDIAMFWYQKGKLHRDNNQPAIISKNGNGANLHWFVCDKRIFGYSCY